MGIEPLSPALAGRFFTTDPAGQPHVVVTVIINGMRRSQCLQVPRWHGREIGCYGYESEWTPGVGDGQGGLVCCSPWDHKESDMTDD